MAPSRARPPRTASARAPQPPARLARGIRRRAATMAAGATRAASTARACRAGARSSRVAGRRRRTRASRESSTRWRRPPSERLDQQAADSKPR
eukprot:5358330-Prymnesium_polylepis.1